MNTCLDIISNTITEQYVKQQAANQWHGSRYEKINDLKNDFSGKAGELILKNLCKKFGISHLYTGTIDPESTYDIIIKSKKVEIKTARMGAHGSFQHESLRSYGCDYFAFIDIYPDHIILTVLSSGFNFSKRHPIVGRKPHLRKGTSNVYKFDFGLASHKNVIKAGVALKIDENTKDCDIENFLNKMIK
tara:strand:- start:30 stop:596 length:567 start_codon:yes stop_codon:yes gene_type:complete